MQPFLRQNFLHHELPPVILKKSRITLIDLGQLSQQLNSGDEEEILSCLLTYQEQQLYAGFSYPKRRVEWLGGRLAAKCALGQLLGGHTQVPCNTVSILPDIHGKPVVSFSFRPLEEANVSISHSVDYATAIASKSGNCGIDIQCSSERLLRVQERFASHQELAFLGDERDRLTRLAILWTAKEAMKKCYLPADPTFFGKLLLVGAEKRNGRQWRLQCCMQESGAPAATVHVLLFDQYSLACVLGESDA